jgi:hypothetical protein
VDTAYFVRLRNLSFGEKTCSHIQVEIGEGEPTVIGPFGMSEHVSVAAKLHILDYNLS